MRKNKVNNLAAILHHPLFEEENRICCFQDCAFENLKCCDYANEKKLQVFSIFLVNLLLT